VKKSDNDILVIRFKSGLREIWNVLQL